MRKNRGIPDRIITIAFFCVILIAQTAVMATVGFQKKDYHIDEIYSYIISNSYDTDRISNAEKIWGTWFDGEQLQEFVTVQEGEEFSYDAAYRNTSTDCHPPMFYWALHTICSFFPNQFNKWFGIALNIGCFLVSQIFLFLISKLLIKNQWLSFLPVIMYGFSPVAIDTVTFIRMYMMLAMFAAIFTYSSLRLIQKKELQLRWAIPVWLMIYCGSMTQYYFLIFSFWMVLITCFIFLRKKQYRKMLVFGIGSLISVALMLISFPYAIGQATGISTNNIGNEVVKNLWNFELWARMFVSLVKQMIASISYHQALPYLILACAVGFIGLAWVVGKKSEKQVHFPEKTVLFLVLAIVLTVLSVAFIGGEYVYLRYVYFIMPIVYVCAVSIIAGYLSLIPKSEKLIAVTCVAFAISNVFLGTVRQQSSYLFSNVAEDIAALQEYNQYPLVVLADGKSTAIPTGNLTRMEQFSRIYMDSRANIEADKTIESCIENEGSFVLYIPTDNYWVTGYDAEELLSSLKGAENCSSQRITNGFLGQYYYFQTNHQP